MQQSYLVITKWLYCVLGYLKNNIFHWTAECTPAEAFKYAGENIVFASGSPFQNVDLGTQSLALIRYAAYPYETFSLYFLVLD